MKIVLGLLAALALVALVLWSLGDLRARPPGALGVCPDTPRERDLELAAKRTHDAQLDAVERAARALAEGHEPSDADQDEYCAWELVRSCERAPDLAALTASVAAERKRIEADRRRLKACDYLRGD
ncbi:MAG: hypothetical protein RIT81_36180 [Deltaproteobacteria bacterium]